MRLLSHADDGVRADATKRPLHASPDPGDDTRLWLAQCLQYLPHQPGCWLGRSICPPMEDARLSGSGSSARRLDRRGAETRLYQAARNRELSCQPGAGGDLGVLADPVAKSLR